MGGPADVRSREVFPMTREATVEDLFRLHLRISTDVCFAAARLHVRFAGSVTALASGALGGFLTRGDALVVRVLEKVLGDVRMTCLADGAADIFRRCRVRWGGCWPGLSP